MLEMLLRKQDAPPYKAVHIEFPASEFELQEKLNSIGIGISPEKNCFISAFTGMSALSFLVNEVVNADEVQFLAKRMDSFDKNELQTFYAAVHVEKPETVADLINLTFNTHCYTAISDFSNIEKIGRNHELNRQGCMTYPEMEKLNFAAIGKELIDSGKGEVTPFGVLYRNGNRPEVMYNGEQFPEYHYRDEVATVTLEFEGAHEYLYLPCAEVEIEKAATSVTLDPIRAIKSCESAVLRPRPSPAGGWRGYTGEHSSAREAHRERSEPCISAEMLCALEDVVVLAENFYEFSAVPNIQTAEEYGKHIAKWSCKLDWNIDKYVDFKRFGEDIIAKENGEFTEFGYIAYRGDTPAVLEILEADRQEQGQGMKMGGM